MPTLLNHLLYTILLAFFLSSKSALFVNANDIVNKKTEPYKQDDKII